MDLSVIILSYNTKDVTKKCLEKVMEAKKYCENKLKNKVEVIVLDNASEDGSANMVKQDFPDVKLIASKENTGFSKGNNMVMKQSKYPYILLLNSDVYLEEDTLYKALAYFRVNLNCDVLGAKLKYASGKLQPSTGYLPNPFNSTPWIFGISNIPIIERFTQPFHPTYRSFFTRAHQVGWVSGAFFMLRREVFDKTSGFDENIFMYMDEVEWCKRIKDKGFKVWYVPQVEVVHLHGASNKFDLKVQYINELKGIQYYFKKHYPSQYLLVRPVLILGVILRIIAFSLFGKTQRARAYVEGLPYV